MTWISGLHLISSSSVFMMQARLSSSSTQASTAVRALRNTSKREALLTAGWPAEDRASCCFHLRNFSWSSILPVSKSKPLASRVFSTRGVTGFGAAGLVCGCEGIVAGGGVAEGAGAAAGTCVLANTGEPGMGGGANTLGATGGAGVAGLATKTDGGTDGCAGAEVGGAETW